VLRGNWLLAPTFKLQGRGVRVQPVFGISVAAARGVTTRVVENIGQTAANLERARQGARVVTAIEDLAPPAPHAVEAAGQPDAQPLHGA